MRKLALCAWTLLAALPGCTYDCNASNCSGGCCGTNGVCLVGGTDESCGLGGAACQDCGAQGRFCDEGRCDLACVRDSPCETGADCCDAYICFETKCSSCRGSDQTCHHNEDCCGYTATNPGRRCEVPDGYPYFVCR